MKNPRLNIVRGATMTEYLLLFVLIAAAAVVAMVSLGTSPGSFFSDLASHITNYRIVS